MTHDTPIPDDACEFCQTRLGWRSAKKAAWVLIPLLMTASIAAGSAAGASLVRDATLDAKVTALEKIRVEDIEARQRLGAEVSMLRSKAALRQEVEADRWTTVQTSLARIEEQLAAITRRRR
jgi:hypothetical protein